MAKVCSRKVHSIMCAIKQNAPLSHTCKHETWVKVDVIDREDIARGFVYAGCILWQSSVTGCGWDADVAAVRLLGTRRGVAAVVGGRGGGRHSCRRGQLRSSCHQCTTASDFHTHWYPSVLRVSLCKAELPLHCPEYH